MIPPGVPLGLALAPRSLVSTPRLLATAAAGEVAPAPLPELAGALVLEVGPELAPKSPARIPLVLAIVSAVICSAVNGGTPADVPAGAPV